MRRRLRDCLAGKQTRHGCLLTLVLTRMAGIVITRLIIIAFHRMNLRGCHVVASFSELGAVVRRRR